MESLIKNIGYEEFYPEKYVKELSQRCMGSEELLQQKTNVERLGEQINTLLKKNVFYNYTQFIDTAKEIANLEGEMYQLSHLLTEQASLLNSLICSSIVSEKVPSPDKLYNGEANIKQDNTIEEKRYQKLLNIMERIDNCKNLVDVPDRKFIHEGDLLELDPIENIPIQRIHCYLLTDICIVAIWMSSRRGPAKYRFQSMYDLRNVAVVNMKDIKNSFKLLAFPDTRVFQAPNTGLKNDWLAKFEAVKKLQVSIDSKVKSTVEQKTLQRMDSIQLTQNLFELETLEVEIPDWIVDLADDLDVLIAQRHFEDANTLINKAKKYLKDHSNLVPTSIEQETKSKLENRIQALTLALTKELQVSPDKSHKGGLRAARRAVKILNELDKSSQACNLFLKVCSNLLKSQLQYVKRDGSVSTFVKKYSMAFFGTTIEITHEFLYKAFTYSPECSSAFILWVTQEVNDFMIVLNKHMFVPQTSLSSLAECIKILHMNSHELCEYGIDLKFQIDGQLRIPLSKSINDIKDKILEVLKIRFSEEKWRPYNLKTKQQRDKLIEEFKNNGFSNIESFIKDLANAIDQLLYEVFAAHCSFIQSSIKNKNYINDVTIITTNARFILDVLLTHCWNLYTISTSNTVSHIFTKLKSEFGVIPTQNITSYI
ncbi:exocyst complex component 8 isoform X2 [Daktulosphaira vitifoliae]|uniref:exocyst complex component 8 isoform X2 n=1 Tax=Daktulosphaira vitifoliae TaxID=58002 RepID=UPI0021A98F98|nr:exocyst complex component 8 isoform X2 [Daktulosphaira vitifoliae]